VALVGRRRETEALERVLGQAMRDVPGLLVLVGPFGSGKSLLAEAAVSRGAARFAGVLQATGNWHADGFHG
jgi:type II secretory ATPase GspE/PulE/Tfp pilus assembly ATPase PilB-like protein